MIKAIWRIKADRLYESGEIIPGLTIDDEADLVHLGAAAYVGDDPRPAIQGTVVADKDVRALMTVLSPCTKNQLLDYAAKAEVAGVSDRMNKDLLLTTIEADAKAHGIDLNALSDEQLVAFAAAAEINVEPGADREQLLDQIVAAIEGTNNEPV